MTTLPVSDRARAAIVQAVIEEYSHLRQIPTALATNVLTKQSVKDAFASFEREITQSTADRVAELEAALVKCRDFLIDEVGFEDDDAPLPDVLAALKGSSDVRS